MNKHPTILIVDDHLSAREVLEGVLTGQGYRLAFAHDGPLPTSPKPTGCWSWTT